ncbi:MAG: hypothetical protein SFY80_15750 [Verrucomicrobiota bacterium]|nr:hypothetical protein [Verrucomicrobiota bacterium]
MQIEQQIRINQLLLERDELFVRISEIERTAANILGEPYPFSRPPLPSDYRAKPKPPPKAKAARSLVVRPLLDSESCYRVTYVQYGQPVQEDHLDPAAITTLLASQTAQLKVVALDTVDKGGRVIAKIYG